MVTSIGNINCKPVGLSKVHSLTATQNEGTVVQQTVALPTYFISGTMAETSRHDS